jgi:hypothetical protein
LWYSTDVLCDSLSELMNIDPPFWKKGTVRQHSRMNYKRRKHQPRLQIGDKSVIVHEDHHEEDLEAIEEEDSFLFQGSDIAEHSPF